MIRAYIRVSDRSQVEKFGIMAQNRTICEWVKLHHPDGHTQFYTEEGISGTIPFDERPESSKLLNDLQEGDILICAFASRFARKLWISAKLLDDVEDKGCEVHLPEMGKITADNRVMFYFKAYEAEADRVNILKNTQSGREAKRKEGGYIGGKPQPWQRQNKVTKELEEDPEGLALVIRVKSLLQSGMKQIDIVHLIKSEGGQTSKTTISNWSKQLKDPDSEMSKKLKGDGK